MDVFSLGLIAVELAAMWPLPTEDGQWRQLREGDLDDLPWSHIPEDLADAIRLMLAHEPAARPTVDELLAHAAFAPIYASRLGPAAEPVTCGPCAGFGLQRRRGSGVDEGARRPAWRSVGPGCALTPRPLAPTLSLHCGGRVGGRFAGRHGDPVVLPLAGAGNVGALGRTRIFRGDTVVRWCWRWRWRHERRYPRRPFPVARRHRFVLCVCVWGGGGVFAAAAR